MTNGKHEKGMTLQQQDDGKMGMMTTKKQHTTHTQPHEPLLMGWIVHGMMTMSNSSKMTER
jgi:hypothetical protein